MESREIIAALGSRFIQRKDVKAVQQADGSWKPVRSKFTMTDMLAHLEGKISLGHYTVDAEGMTKIFCFDIDLRKRDDGSKGGRRTALRDSEGSTLIDPRACWIAEPSEMDANWQRQVTAWQTDLRMQLRCMAEGLALRTARMTGLPVCVVDTGRKGLHVYGITGTRPAPEVRAVADAVLASYGCFVNSKGTNFFMHDSAYDCLEIEVFPKQTDMEGKELGNLLALPLGLHRATGRWRNFVRLDLGIEQGWDQISPEQGLTLDHPWLSEDYPNAPAGTAITPASVEVLWTTPGPPNACPRCASTQIRWAAMKDLDTESTTCDHCGWTETRAIAVVPQQPGGGDGSTEAGVTPRPPDQPPAAPPPKKRKGKKASEPDLFAAAGMG